MNCDETIFLTMLGVVSCSDLIYTNNATSFYSFSPYYEKDINALNVNRTPSAVVTDFDQKTNFYYLYMLLKYTTKFISIGFYEIYKNILV